MSRTLKKTLQLILFFTIGFGLLYLVFKKQESSYQSDCVLKGIPEADCDLIQKVFEDFSNANFYWIGLVLVCFLLSNLSRAIRWNMLLEPLGKRAKTANLFFGIMLGYFANLGFPRIGEVIRAGTVARYENIPAEKVMGTVVVDRVMDVLMLLIFIGITLIVEFDELLVFLTGNADPESAKKLIILGGILMVGGLIAAYLVFRIRKLFQHWKIYKMIYRIVVGFVDGIKTVGKLRNTFSFLFHSVFIWIMFFMMNYLGFHSFEPTSQLAFGAALVVFLSGAFSFVIPVPGGMGTYHFLIPAALSIYGINDADGFSYANIMFFSVTISCTVFFGLISLIAFPLINKPK